MKCCLCHYSCSYSYSSATTVHNVEVAAFYIGGLLAPEHGQLETAQLFGSEAHLVVLGILESQNVQLLLKAYVGRATAVKKQSLIRE